MDPLQAEIDNATRRAALYWVQDGLQEALFGAVFVLIGLFLALEDLLPRQHPLQFVFASGFPLLLVAIGLLARYAVMRLKDRYVHPRTGYVSCQPAGRTASATAAVLAAVIAFAFVLLMRLPAVLAWLPVVQGMVFAAVFLYLGQKAHLARFPVEGLLAVLGGFALALPRLGQNLQAGLLFVWIGVVMAGGGMLAFRNYLQQQPPGERA